MNRVLITMAVLVFLMFSYSFSQPKPKDAKDSKTEVKPVDMKIVPAKPGDGKPADVKHPSEPDTKPVQPKSEVKPEPATPAAPVAPGEEMIELVNLSDIDIKDVLKVIDEQTEMSITVSKEVSGKIDINIGRVTLTKALDYVVKKNNFYYVIEDNIISVTSKESVINRTFKIKNVKADNIRKLMAHYLSERGSAEILEESNLLLIKDIASKMGELEKLIKQWDVPPETSIEKKTVTLQYVNANEIRETINSLKSDRGRIDVVGTYLIIIYDTPEKIKEICEVIDNLEKAKEADTVKPMIFDLKFVNPEEILTAVETMLSEKGKCSKVGKSQLMVSDIPSRLKIVEKFIQELEEKQKLDTPQTRTYLLEIVKPEDIMEAVKVVLTKQGTIQKTGKNQILVFDIPAKLDEIDKLIKEFEEGKKKDTLETLTIKLEYVKPETIKEAVKANLTEKGTVTVVGNQLVVMDVASRLDAVKAFVKEIEENEKNKLKVDTVSEVIMFPMDQKAENFIAVVKPFLTNAGSVSAHENKLIIVETAANLKRLKEMLQKVMPTSSSNSNDDVLNTMTYTLKYVDGAKVLDSVKALLSARGKATAYGNKLIVVDINMNLDKIKTVIKEIDAYDTKDSSLKEKGK